MAENSDQHSADKNTEKNDNFNKIAFYFDVNHNMSTLRTVHTDSGSPSSLPVITYIPNLIELTFPEIVLARYYYEKSTVLKLVEFGSSAAPIF
ncbi:hypothetical protein KUTeg_003141 [Tegillarca granosa]|uniref:Uncharacterized protein n=1 Tax=Tegillarca granosa TaxID=220873 RepID=A0ABQ9FLA2_TEGGR|nr:hypothetical protein KUTeg_003141 [Tegillarca granosa]